MKRLMICLLIAVLVLTGGIVWYMNANCMNFSTGRCIVTSNGSYMILLDNSPIKMSNQSGKDNLFDDIQTGDEILILHDGIEDSYPGGTGVYFCKKQASGSVSDIPTEIIESLGPMGWIPVDGSGKTHEIYTGTVLSFDPVYQDEGNYLLKIHDEAGFIEEITVTVVQGTELQIINGLTAGDRVRMECYTEESGYKEAVLVTEYQQISYEYGYANMSLELPAGWAYQVREYDEESDRFGIDFWPENESEGKIRLDYYMNGFGVCGTGLAEEQIWIGQGYKALQGTYDNNAIWDFISVRGLPGSYVIDTENVSSWWDVYEEQAMGILDSMRLAEGIIHEYSAIEIATQATKNEYQYDRAKFDFCTGEWVITFVDGSAQYAVYVAADGTVRKTDTFNPDAAVAEKPVIYLYPKQEMLVRVELDFDGTLTSTYPEYANGWNILARPDGALVDPVTGRQYYCLFWEGLTDAQYDLSSGFVVPGGETREFLEDALFQMGLTDKEANEFIIYWLPQMEGNAYNLISFQQEAYTDSAHLIISPEPDSLLRVFMAWKPLDAPIEIPPQEFAIFDRKGFVVVEWGGAKLP